MCIAIPFRLAYFSRLFRFRGAMRQYQILRFVFLSITLFGLSGCSVTPKTLKETSLDDMYPILTEEEYDALSSLDSDAEIDQFLD